VGPLQLPGSKSLAQRALVCAALCGEQTRVEEIGWGDDVAALTKALGGLGVAIEGVGSGSLSIRGRPPGTGDGLFQSVDGGVSLGESGTAGRLLTAVTALCGRIGGAIVLEPAGSLRSRSSPALLETLRVAGAGLTSPDGGTGQATGWPLRIEPVVPPADLRLVRPGSSQELSGLLIACAAWPGLRSVTCEGALPSAPYVEMTRSVLSIFGVRVERESLADGRTTRWIVHGPLRSPSRPFVIEPDASAAAVALAAACLSGGDLKIPGLGPDSPQGDVRIATHLEAFGCDAALSDAGLSARVAPTRGVDLDLSGEPDLAPVLAAVAAAVALQHGQGSRLRGLGTLPGKESARIDVLAQGLSRIGLRAEAGPEELTIAPGPGPVAAGIELDPHGDHRMAFCFALLGLLVPGVAVRTPECVAKSWPGFWKDMRHAGLKGLHQA